MTQPARAGHAVLDAHVHYWDPASLDYPWLEELPALRRSFGPSEYAAAIVDVPVTGTLFVEANCRPEQNAREVLFAESLAGVAGVVAFADLAALGPAALDTLPPSLQIKGVRQNIQGQPPGFCLGQAFVEGAREAGRRGFVLDLCVTHDQLSDVVELLDRCPDGRFVLDHCGKPSVRTGEIDDWARDLAAVAARDQVWCKLSGLLTEARADQTESDILPYAEHVVASFGPRRMLYGSDWPVLTLAGSYTRWYELTRRVVTAWSAAERAAFYGENAATAYRL